MSGFLNPEQFPLQSSGQEGLGCPAGMAGCEPASPHHQLQKKNAGYLGLGDHCVTLNQWALSVAQSKSLCRSDRLKIEGFLEGAQKEAPHLEKYFFEACVSCPPFSKMPAVFVALACENWSGVEQFLRWGVPTSLPKQSKKGTVLLGEVIFDRCLEKLRQSPARSRGAVSCLKTWLQYASEQEAVSLFCRDKTFAASDGQRVPPEFWLMDRDRSDILVLLLESGLPLAPRKNCGLLFAEEVLRFFEQDSYVDTGLWSAIVNRCQTDSIDLFSVDVLKLSAEDLAEKIQEDWDELLADVRARGLNLRWETSVKIPTHRPRL